jgi:hypothetical protein
MPKTYMPAKIKKKLAIKNLLKANQTPKQIANNPNIAMALVTNNDFNDLWQGVTKFKGHGYPPVQTFLQSIEDCAKVANWNDSLKIFYARFRMADEATLFCEASDALRQAATWDKFKEILISRFGSQASSAMKLMKFSECKQLPDESVLTYASRLRHLASRMYPLDAKATLAEIAARTQMLSERVLVQFILGLRNNEIKRQLRNETDLDKVMRLAALAEADAPLYGYKEETTINAFYGNMGPPAEQKKSEIAKGPKLDFHKLSLNNSHEQMQQKAPQGQFSQNNYAMRGARGAQNFRGQVNPFGSRGRGYYQARGAFPRTQQQQQQQYYQPRQYYNQQQYRPNAPRRQYSTLQCAYCAEYGHAMKYCPEFNSSANKQLALNE